MLSGFYFKLGVLSLGVRRSRFVVSAVVAVLCLGSCGGTAVEGSQSGRSSQAAPPTASEAQNASQRPPARADGELVYDSRSKRVVLIGGETPEGPVDTGASVLWAWDGEQWSAIDSRGPKGRALGAVAFDDRRRRLVLYGGRTLTGALHDTWEWGRGGWLKLGAAIPGGISNHLSGVYDHARGQTIIAFGQDAEGKLSPATWGWDGRQWSLLSATGPPPRAHYAMAYDRRRQVVVLFGGYDPVAGSDLDDVWEWDGKVWRDVTPVGDGPGARAGAGMTFDGSTGTVLMFGGNTAADDTWSWNGRSWQRLSTHGPPARGYFGIAFDAKRRETVLFGGGDGGELADTWLWNGSEWRQGG